MANSAYPDLLASSGCSVKFVIFLFQLVKRDGEEQYDFCPEENHYPMFFRPWYIKMDSQSCNVYISDSNRSQMACILTGNVLKQYTYKVR